MLVSARAAHPRLEDDPGKAEAGARPMAGDGTEGLQAAAERALPPAARIRPPIG